MTLKLKENETNVNMTTSISTIVQKSNETLTNLTETWSEWSPWEDCKFCIEQGGYIRRYRICHASFSHNGSSHSSIILLSIHHWL
jgi:hypothetical protein